MSFIKFLGTAGARFVVTKQLRSSGGIWISYKDTQVLFDPGPGSLVRSLFSRPKLDPSKLDGVILSHKHLDHSGDINIIIEAMTEGGFKKRGFLFAPEDALARDKDPVVLNYLKEYLEEIVPLKEMKTYRLKDLAFSTGRPHIHPVETYGFNLHTSPFSVSFITDTRFFPEIFETYRGDILIMNVVRINRDHLSKIDHLSLDDIRDIIKGLNPKLAILTHFGMTVLKAKPWELVKDLQLQTGVKVIAARDGMVVSLDALEGIK